ncbi:inositol polyphosphate kinase-domain-containing protein [Chaetomium fimeti]|uniref:Kinase n=1 Tax=Chaetomium fimeti TaxID=1854472 RepID=A0AAE0HDQ6_9PEZI|nr:inositol polyphosphate kinase-domain-containing protein [Chaetomium fimeti]
MATSRELPSHADLQPFNHAVAGHDGTLSDIDGELFIKPCVQQEIDFYEKTFRDHLDFASLMPHYIGTLALNDATNIESLNEQLPVVADHISQELKEEAVSLAKATAAEAAAQPAAQPAAEQAEPPVDIAWKPNKGRRILTDKSVVLQNSTHGFKKPNILDVKLGQRLWADDAPMEKRKRFDEISKLTTHASHGFRISGMRVYKGSDNPEEWNADDFHVYNKDYGRFEVNKDNVVQVFAKFIFNERAGIDQDLGRAVVQAFLEDLRQVEEVLARSETRMYSASLLFTFEGDGEALQAAIEENNALVEKVNAAQEAKLLVKENGSLPERAVNGVAIAGEHDSFLEDLKRGEERHCNGISLAQETIAGIDVQAISGAIEGDLKVVELMGDVLTDDEEDDDDDDELSSQPRIFSLKLIDFAHAKWVPGQGPDENSLLGVRSLIKIFEELAQ